MVTEQVVQKACSLHNDEGGLSPRGLRLGMATGHVVPKARSLHNGEGGPSP